MTGEEIDRLLAGQRGLAMELKTPTGIHWIRFSRRELMNPAAHRAAWRRKAGHEIPHYSEADHDQLVRVMFRLADSAEAKLERRAEQGRRAP